MNTTITREQNITVLKHLANGRDTDWVATVTKLPQDTVEQLADDAGWPNTDKLVASIENLTRAANAVPERIDHTVTPGGAPTSTTAPPVNTRPNVGTSTAELLHLAAESHKAGTRTLGKRISGLLADLTQRIHDETAERQAREAAAAEKARNAKRIAELKAELARLQGKPAPTRPAATAASSTQSSDEPTAAQIRVWASENGIECPAVGRVPGAVREAYDDAHTKHDAA